MGFVTSAERVVCRAMAGAMAPPLPPDITRWCVENIEFDERSPIKGPFDISRFAFLREIHEVLSPEHPSREVTIRGSAQWGKTVSISGALIRPPAGRKTWSSDASPAAGGACRSPPMSSSRTSTTRRGWLP